MSSNNRVCAQSRQGLGSGGITWWPYSQGDPLLVWNSARFHSFYSVIRDKSYVAWGSILQWGAEGPFNGGGGVATNNDRQTTKCPGITDKRWWITDKRWSITHKRWSITNSDDRKARIYPQVIELSTVSAKVGGVTPHIPYFCTPLASCTPKICVESWRQI